MSEPLWHRVSPLAVVFFFGKTLAMVAKNLWQTALPASAYLATTGGFTLDRILWVIFAGLVVAALYSIASWWNTRYQLKSEELILKTGVFQRRQLNLDYSKIQSVSETRNPVYRLAGVADLRLDSPGSGDAEAELPALRPAVVADIRERVRSARTSAPATDAAAEPAEINHGTRLIELNFGDLVRIGLSSNRAVLFWAVVGSAIGAFYSQDVPLPVGFDIKAIFEDWLLSIPKSLWIVVGLAAALALFVLVKLFSVIGAIIRFSGFNLYADEETLSTKAGLMTQYSQSLSLAKIQVISAHRGILQSAFGLTSLKLAQTGGASSGKNALDIPAVTQETRPPVFQTVAGPVFDDVLSAQYERPSRRYLTTRILAFGLVPGVILCALAATESRLLEALLVAGGWLMIVSALLVLRYLRLGIAAREDRIAMRRGMLGTSWQFMEPRKCQAVLLQQSPFQRRRDLVKFTVFNASNSMSMSYLPAELASEVAEHCLEAAADKPWQ